MEASLPPPQEFAASLRHVYTAKPLFERGSSTRQLILDAVVLAWVVLTQVLLTAWPYVSILILSCATLGRQCAWCTCHHDTASGNCVFTASLLKARCLRVQNAHCSAIETFSCRGRRLVIPAVRMCGQLDATMLAESQHRSACWCSVSLVRGLPLHGIGHRSFCTAPPSFAQPSGGLSDGLLHLPGSQICQIQMSVTGALCHT
jgi:hypothetical protein